MEFGNNVKVFIVFDQFNAALLNKSIYSKQILLNPNICSSLV